MKEEGTCSQLHFMQIRGSHQALGELPMRTPGRVKCSVVHYTYMMY